MRSVMLAGLVAHHPAMQEKARVEQLQPLLADLQDAIPPEELTAALEAGAALDLDTVVTELLAEFAPEDASEDSPATA